MWMKKKGTEKRDIERKWKKKEIQEKVNGYLTVSFLLRNNS